MPCGLLLARALNRDTGDRTRAEPTSPITGDANFREIVLCGYLYRCSPRDVVLDVALRAVSVFGKPSLERCVFAATCMRTIREVMC